MITFEPVQLVQLRVEPRYVLTFEQESRALPFNLGFGAGTASAAQVSTDSGNALSVGTDGGIYFDHPKLSSSQW